MAAICGVFFLSLALIMSLVLLLAVGKRLTRPKSAPPLASEGLPVIGNLIAFASGPLSFIERSYERHGSAFSMQVFHKTLTFLIGPQASAPFFSNGDNVFSQAEVYGFMTQVFGKDVVYDAAPDKRKAQMQHMSRGLRADRLKSYVPKIASETRKFLAEAWPSAEGTLDVLNSLSELTILTSTRCLHGDDVRETMFKKVATLYHDLDKGITPLAFFWPTAPVASHKKRDLARTEMVKLFSKVIAKRREERADTNRDDILQVFIDMHYKDGTKATDDQITGLLIALLFAGQHTSSITSTWTILFIAANPDIKRRVLEEQAMIFKDRDWNSEPAFEDLNKMELLHNCIKEALRLHPPLIMLMRKCLKDVQVQTERGSFVVPKGDITITSPAVSGRIPQIFENPHVFDPDRYMPPREEHKKMPFAHLGFGAGIHQCMGQQFGYTQVKTILSVILRQFDVALPAHLPFPEPDYQAMVVGPKGCPLLTYKRRDAEHRCGSD